MAALLLKGKGRMSGEDLSKRNSGRELLHDACGHIHQHPGHLIYCILDVC